MSRTFDLTKPLAEDQMDALAAYEAAAQGRRRSILGAALAAGAGALWLASWGAEREGLDCTLLGLTPAKTGR